MAQLFFALDASADFLLAGGAALAAQHLIDRPTLDLDFFTRPGGGTVEQARDEFIVAALGRDWTVDRIRDRDTFCRLLVHGSEDLLVDLALDRCETARCVRTGRSDRLNGLDLCRKLRSLGLELPVLMLTSSQLTGDRVAGLDSGAGIGRRWNSLVEQADICGPGLGSVDEGRDPGWTTAPLDPHGVQLDSAPRNQTRPR